MGALIIIVYFSFIFKNVQILLAYLKFGNILKFSGQRNVLEGKQILKRLNV